MERIVNSIFFLYVTFRFDWTPKDIGVYATFVTLTSLAVQSGLVARVIERFGERRSLPWVRTGCSPGFRYLLVLR